MSYTIDGVTITEAQAERIVAQVEARKQAASTFAVGDTVTWHGNTYQVKEVHPTMTTSLTLTRKDGGMDVSVDASTITKVTPPQPIPGQVYRHRETTDEKPYTHYVYRLSPNYTVEVQQEPGGTWSPSLAWSIRDLERKVASGERVPYTPPVITNATHAGRRVRAHEDVLRFNGIVVELFVARKVNGYAGRTVVIEDGTGKYYAILTDGLTLLD